MYTVNFIPKSSPNTLTFVFKFHKAAEDLYKKALAALKAGEDIEIEDDFTTKGIVKMPDMSAITFSEYESDMDRNGDLQIIQHKCQLKTQNKAKGDMSIQILENAPMLRH